MASDEMHYLTLLEAGRKISSGEISSLELTETMLARVEKLNASLHPYVTVLGETARAEAKHADAELARGETRGPMHGVPIAVKDLMAIAGVRTSAGMPILKDRKPDHDATVVTRLRAAGAVILGKLELTEGAYAAHHPDITDPVNPWNADYWPGVSSSGSGVATAAGLCFGSLGTDTGGSIRFPSLACGVVGLKPTWGRVSRYGVYPLSETLDHIGPMTRSVGDAAAMLGALAGVDAQDPTSLTAEVPDYLAALADGMRGLRIGVDEQFNSSGVDAAVTDALNTAINVLRGEGAQIQAVTMPPHDDVVDSWIPICSAEAALGHSETYPSRASEYGPVMGGLLETGVALSGADYARATIHRRNYSGQLAKLFDDVDLIAAPSMLVPTPRLDGMDELLGAPGALERLIRFTSPFDHSGSPTLSLPCGFTEAGTPLGFQLIGRHLGEGVLLRAGHAFERATVWNDRHPNV
ncbi:MAG: amidase [Proteobacteria bacterium]|nr:amidase [Pseudomonadota bacterium]MDA1356104.1 amidase [Pseudomonadota bacterium]